jgi:hypothetical protein
MGKDLLFAGSVRILNKTSTPCYSAKRTPRAANSPSARTSNEHVREKHGSQRQKKKESGTYSNRDSYPVANQRGVDEINFDPLKEFAG